MTILKIPLKLIALPVALAMTAAKWFGLFLTSFAGAILYLISGLFFIVAVLSYLMGICTGAEAVETLVQGFIIFILPAVASWLMDKLVDLNESIWDFIIS